MSTFISHHLDLISLCLYIVYIFLNKLIVGEDGRIGSELSTGLTKDQATQLKFAASRKAETPKGVAVSWLLMEQKSGGSIPNKKAVARLPTDV